MKISEAQTYLASVVKYNLEMMEKGRGHSNFVVPMFIGDPGVGKTAICRQVARNYGLPYYQTILAQFDAGELAGLPFKATVNVQADEFFASEKDALAFAAEHRKANPNVQSSTHEEDGKKVIQFTLNYDEDRMVRLRPNYLPDAPLGLWNLDELPQAFLANQNIASQIVNEYRVGEHTISPGVTICCTGNKPENKAGTTTMPSHLKDRLNFIPLEANLEEWMQYAVHHDLDTRVRAFLRQNPSALHKFEPGQQANPTPRSWEKTSAIMSMNLPRNIRREALSGQIGEATATTFEAWLRVEDKMPKIEDILTNPEKAPTFGNKEADVLYLLLANLASIADDKNIEAILKYINRLPNQEFTSYWAKDTFTRNPKLFDNKHVSKWKFETAVNLLY
jgi:MoxR-like ATPase